MKLEIGTGITLSIEDYNKLKGTCGDCVHWDDAMVKDGGIPLGNKYGYCGKLGRSPEGPAYLVDEFLSGSLKTTAEFGCNMFAAEEKPIKPESVGLGAKVGELEQRVIEAAIAFRAHYFDAKIADPKLDLCLVEAVDALLEARK